MECFSTGKKMVRKSRAGLNTMLSILIFSVSVQWYRMISIAITRIKVKASLSVEKNTWLQTYFERYVPWVLSDKIAYGQGTDLKLTAQGMAWTKKSRAHKRRPSSNEITRLLYYNWVIDTQPHNSIVYKYNNEKLLSIQNCQINIVIILQINNFPTSHYFSSLSFFGTTC